MNLRLNRSVALTCCAILFVGAGCTQQIVSDKTPEQAAALLNIEAGSKIILRETIFGVGGKAISLFEGTDADRIISVNFWEPKVRGVFSWERSLKKETDASTATRKKYFDDYTSAAIGTQLPNPPEPVYENILEKGILETNSLENGNKILLPFFWQKDENLKSDSTLIWLSNKQYKELVENRRTEIHLGLFDDSVSYVTGITDQIESFIDQLKGKPQVKDQKNISEIEADIDWKTFRLKVNGVLTDVRAIQAQNAFARYTILANENNPLILEIMLSPASRGTANIFNRKALGEAFWGYEVTDISL
ncbi:hypothetical protein HYV69_01875 [Candidatus Uhrbacteria bacterium]|nr:hypothetical protein [Candidatus Uhrbacteria bacterium]